MNPQEITNYFMDESGHSGDLAKAERGLDFLEQPYFFVLGAVGIPDDLDIAAELARLRSEHHIPPGELKSKSLNYGFTISVMDRDPPLSERRKFFAS